MKKESECFSFTQTHASTQTYKLLQIVDGMLGSHYLTNFTYMYWSTLEKRLSNVRPDAEIEPRTKSFRLKVVTTQLYTYVKSYLFTQKLINNIVSDLAKVFTCIKLISHSRWELTQVHLTQWKPELRTSVTNTRRYIRGWSYVGVLKKASQIHREVYLGILRISSRFTQPQVHVLLIIKFPLWIVVPLCFNIWNSAYLFN